MLIKVKEYQEKMMEGVQKVLESGEFKEFLAFGAKFRNYSFGNTLLIWSQNPEASHVAGFRTWKSLGRWVKKGEKGIVIFAPMIKSKHKTDKKTGAGDKDDGKDNGFLIGFKAVYVYDLSQTEGEPIPEMKIGDIKNGDCDSAASLFDQILTSSPVPVTFDTFSDGKRGVYMIKDEKIIVSSDLTPVEQCKTLLHELAHHLALSTELKDDFSSAGRSSHEVLAEGAAYIACCHFGVDSSEYSFQYLAAWEQDYRKILSFGDGIRKIAVKLIEIASAHKEEEISVKVA